MIKTAQDAYLAGRHAAMVKLAFPSVDSVAQDAKENGQNNRMVANLDGLDQMMDVQDTIAGNVGLGRQGLLADAAQGQSAYNPTRLATMENLARLGMLGGAAGGTYLGGMDPRAAALSSAGAIGGGQLGGNLGLGLNAALAAYGVNDGHGYDDRKMQAALGALGGLGGGLGAGYLAR